MVKGPVSQKVVKKSKKRQKVPKSSKAWNVVKIISLKERFPKHWFSVNEKLELPLEFWQFVKHFLPSSGAPSIPFSNWLPTRKCKWSCWYFIAFFYREPRKIFEPKIFGFFTSCNQQSFCTKFLLQKTHVTPPLISVRSWRRRPSPITAWWLGGCRGSCAFPWPVLCSWNHQNWANDWENLRTCC